jgi:hypothetical protein
MIAPENIKLTHSVVLGVDLLNVILIDNILINADVFMLIIILADVFMLIINLLIVFLPNVIQLNALSYSALLLEIFKYYFAKCHSAEKNLL